jgi:hypothetical protein
MRKLLMLLMLLIGFVSSAQDSLAVEVLHLHLQPGEVAVDTSSLVVRQFESGLRDKYSSSDFVYEIQSAEKNFWDRFLEKLSHFIKNLFNIGTTETSMNIALNVVRAISVIIIIVVIFLIVKAVLNKEGSWIFGNSSKKIINYEDLEKNIHSTDFEKLIRSSELAGEKRLSIRYYYLWLLKKMSDRNIIVWDPEKTNTDYLYEIEATTYKENFEYLSYLYNNIWYGEFELNEQTFDRAKSAFEKMIRTI